MYQLAARMDVKPHRDTSQPFLQILNKVSLYLALLLCNLIIMLTLSLVIVFKVVYF